MPGDAPPPFLVNEREAARLLGGLCAKTMFNLRRAGLRHVKIGSRVMYRPAELEAWIDEQQGAQAEQVAGVSQ